MATARNGRQTGDAVEISAQLHLMRSCWPAAKHKPQLQHHRGATACWSGSGSERGDPLTVAHLPWGSPGPCPAPCLAPCPWGAWAASGPSGPLRTASAWEACLYVEHMRAPTRAALTAGRGQTQQKQRGVKKGRAHCAASHRQTWTAGRRGRATAHRRELLELRARQVAQRGGHGKWCRAGQVRARQG